jgi:hypothetical protein
LVCLRSFLRGFALNVDTFDFTLAAISSSLQCP